MTHAARRERRVPSEARDVSLDDAGTERAQRLIAFVAERLGAPIALFSVADGPIERMVTSLGLDEGPWHLDGSLVEVLRADLPFCVPDTAGDPRCHALATAEWRDRVRWIAGAPVLGRDGRRLGALAVADSTPRGPAESAQLELLVDFARAVARILEDRTDAPTRARRSGATVAQARLDVLDRIGSRASVESVASAVATLLRTSDRGCLVHVMLCEGDRLRSIASAGDHLPSATHRDAGSDAGPAELVASIGRPVYVRDVSTESRWPSWRRRAQANGLASASFVPALDVQGGVLAVLVHGRREPSPALEPGLLDEAVRLLACAIDGQRARSELADSLSMASELHCACSSDGWIERANPVWERLTGLSQVDVERRFLLDLVHPDDQAVVAEHLEAPPSDGRRVEFEARLHGEHGEPVPVRWTCRRITGRSTILLTGRDVAREASLEARLAAGRLRDAALRDVDAAVASGTDLRHVLSVVVAATRRSVGVDGVGVLLYDAPTRRLVREVGEGFPAGYDPDVTTAVALGEGVVGRAALERRLVQSDDSVRTPDREGFVVHLAVPLVSRGELLGVVEVRHRSPLPQPEACRAFLTTVAVKAAIALDAHAVRHRCESQRLRLGVALDRTIEGWARALDVRSGAEEDHSRRIALLTVRLARTMGLDERQLEQVYRGALLHDLGEMFLPEGLLDKPGALTPDELAVVARHPVHAREVLQRIEVLAAADVIPYSHHERWDGSGYPEGLAGEAIPIEARIFAVVDVYDALTQDRPHRPAWSKEHAREHLRQQAGRGLDPAVVDAFLALDGAS